MAGRLGVALAAAVLALLNCMSVVSTPALEDGGLEAGRHAYELSDYEKAVKVLQEAAARDVVPIEKPHVLVMEQAHDWILN